MGILRTDIVSHSQLESAGGSVVFDGSGDYLTIPNHSAFHFTGDYTIDFYIKFTTNSGTQRIFGQRDSGGGDISVLGEFASNNFYYYYTQNGSSSENVIIGSYGTNIELNTWHHVAIVSDGGVHHSYLDGVLTAVNVNNPPPLNDGDSTWSIGRQGAYTSDEFSGSIYSFRITTGALYKGNFTVPKFKPKVLPGTLLLCCQSSTSVTEKAVSVAGDITSNGDPQIGDTPLLKEDITDTGVIFDGVTTFDSQAFMVPPSGKTTERNRGRAVMAGGMKYPTANTNIIEMLEIQSGGQTQDFGDLINATQTSGPVSSSTRGVIVSGLGPSARTNAIEFVTIASTGNAIDFGDYVSPLGYVGGVSNQTRGVTCGGSGAPYSPNGTNQMAFITIATAGDATDYGDLSGNTQGAMGVQSSTRGVFNLGYVGGFVNTIEFITIATTGDTTDFGDLSRTNSAFGGSCCSSTRGLFAGGYNNTPASVTEVNNIDFITIASTGNSTDFGDLVTAGFYNYGTSNKTRGIFQGRLTTAPYTGDPIIDSVIIASTGNAVEFGQMHRMDSGPHDGQAIVRRGATTMSDSHGGLS